MTEETKAGKSATGEGKAGEAKSVRARWRDFSIKDRITVSISICALLVSVSTFYVTNLRIQDKLLARVVAQTYLPVPESRLSPGFVEDTEFGISVAFVNAGNRSAIVMNWSASFYDMPSQQWTGGHEMNYEPNPFPLFVPAHDMRLVSLPIPDSVFKHSGIGVNSTTRLPAQREKVLRVGFTSIDSQGVAHKAMSGPQFWIHVDEEGRTRGTRRPHKWKGSIDLFGQTALPTEKP
jgi:hypothetical protein